MKKRFRCTIVILAVVYSANSQTFTDSAYLLRMPEKQNVYIRIPNTGAYFIANAGLKTDHSGWQLPDEFVPRNSNMLYFEMGSTNVPDGPWRAYTGGSLELVIDLPRDIAVLNFDTIDRLSYHLINNYAHSGYDGKPSDRFSGKLNFEYHRNDTVVINGAIQLNTTRPYGTHQQVIYRNASFLVVTLAQFVDAEKKKEELEKWQEDAAENLEMAMAREKGNFFDSLFTKDMAKGCLLTAAWGKQRFKYSLSQSYIVTGASLEKGVEGSLMDMLGANFMAVGAGSASVLLLHSFYDPNSRTFDDKINFSLGIQVDSLAPGKSYVFRKADGPITAVLGYWHYGAFGHPVLSQKVEGTITVSASNNGRVSGKMDLTFYFDKSAVRIYGNYLLLAVPFETVKHFREQLHQKYGNKEEK